MSDDSPLQTFLLSHSSHVKLVPVVSCVARLHDEAGLAFVLACGVPSKLVKQATQLP